MIKFLKFIIIFSLVPVTFSFIVLTPYIGGPLAYILSCLFWGTLTYYHDRINLKLLTCKRKINDNR